MAATMARAVAVLVLGLALLLAACEEAGQVGRGVTRTPAPIEAATATRPAAFEPTPSPAPTLVLVPDLRPPAGALEAAGVVEVIDGDTIDVELDGRTERVRYFGIDTPERGERCFAEATERNRALAEDVVVLLPDPVPNARDRDRYGRLLRYVFDQRGESIDARLIAEGLAYAWREDGAYRDDLVALEEEARAARRGCLWSGA